MGTSRSRERLTKPCYTCGKPVERLKSLDADRWYCNRECYYASPAKAEATRRTNRARHPEAQVEVICDHCSTKFVRVRSRIRAQTFCSQKCRNEHRRAEGRKFLNSDGYVVVGVPSDYPGAKRNGNYGQILEHRKVMQDVLGRPLLPSENVHHKNGDRADNRPENLELWSRSQPSGQRVVDKLAWAREFIQTYEGLSIKE